MEELQRFLDTGLAHVRPAAERQRAEALLMRWAAAWQGPVRRLESTHSIHGAFLHFDQRINGVWSKVFWFRITSQHGLCMRGPDTDRVRKSHKHRAHKLERGGLDALFEAWSAHPEAHPANNAVEFVFVETPDETWEACLKEVLELLKQG